MCGIAGFVGPGDRADLFAMIAALAHRGPDGEGSFVDENTAVFLGHRRLAILDVAGGHQPMWNEDHTVAVIYNGEIYNHLELRDALIARGHRFRSDHSDTEVLVHGYEEWGEDLPVRLNGMFAFAVYDQARRRIFLARDRFGEKPLYYARRGGFLGFASELEALTRHSYLDRTLNGRSLQKYFAYGYIPAPHALYENCWKLPGGHHAHFDIATGDLRIRRYWQFTLTPDEGLSDAAEDRLADELADLLLQSVRRRLISDVPLGIFLSGGIDSSAILAAATAQKPSEQIKTFTVGFDEPSFDESGHARAVAAAFGTEHHEQTLNLGTAREMISAVLPRLDEPLSDPSILPTYLLSRFTRQHVTVALSGDGGDELFAGYDPFKALAGAQLYQRVVPRDVHAIVQRLAALLPISERNMSLDFKLRRGLAGMSYDAALWNPVWLGPVEPSEIAGLFASPLDANDLFDEALTLWHRDEKLDVIDRTLEFYTNLYLQDNILMKVDRAAMMASLESRAIFLDNDVVAFCQRLPNRFKYRNGQRKYLLKKAMSRMLPAAVLDRPKKGFGIPAASWLRTLPEVRPTAQIDGINFDWVAARWKEHRTGRADHRLFLWSWLSLQSMLAPPPLAARKVS